MINQPYRDPTTQPLTAQEKTLLEFAIEAILPSEHDTPPDKWLFLDDIRRDVRPRLPEDKRYNYFYEDDFKRALRRLTRRGSTVYSVYERGWFRKKRYAYGMPF